jgi:hypothetical protein
MQSLSYREELLQKNEKESVVEADITINLSVKILACKLLAFVSTVRYFQNFHKTYGTREWMRLYLLEIL